MNSQAGGTRASPQGPLKTQFCSWSVALSHLFAFEVSLITGGKMRKVTGSRSKTAPQQVSLGKPDRAWPWRPEAAPPNPLAGATTSPSLCVRGLPACVAFWNEKNTLGPEPIGEALVFPSPHLWPEGGQASPANRAPLCCAPASLGPQSSAHSQGARAAHGSPASQLHAFSPYLPSSQKGEQPEWADIN